MDFLSMLVHRLKFRVHFSKIVIHWLLLINLTAGS